MESDLTSRVRELFAEAAERPPEDRAAFLDQTCGNDATLREDVLSLLHAYEKARDLSFMAGATLPFRDADACPTGLAPADARLASERPGDHVGQYRLIERIGEGGFGDVYLAEQERPVRRRVALKVVKLGMDTRQVVARFEAERQALAMMDHINIARVFDAGATDAGRPYFVMELVNGLPVTEYCDANKLSIRQRLELFVRVCRAVQHAHHKGIIHRDIKPSNILVAVADGQPIPKVIDFGIAKAVRAPSAGQTTLGDFKHAGTPQYMSPEQADLSGIDVDTRSDIYSLGVLLYELLSGTTPLDAQALRGKPCDEVQKAIRETDPPFPSTRIAALGREAATTAKARGVDAAKLRRTLQGELDWVVLKCLERDRSARYQTAEGLAKDVQRYLDGWPVVARRAATSRRLLKFALRNKVPVSAAATIVLLLVMGVVGTSIGLVRALKAQQEAQAQAQLANDLLAFLRGILTSPQPIAEGGGGAVTLVQFLERASGEIDRVQEKQPEAAVALRALLGRAYLSLGLYRPAEKEFYQAVAQARTKYGADHAKTIEAAIKLSEVRAKRIADEALPPTDETSVVAGAFARETCETARRVLGPRNPLTWDAAAVLGEVLQARGQYAGAEELYTSLLRDLCAERGLQSAPNSREYYRERRLPLPELILNRKAGDELDDERVARYVYSLALALRAQMNPADAARCLGDAWDQFERSGRVGRITPGLRARILSELGVEGIENNKPHEARPMWERAVAEADNEGLPRGHPEVQGALDGYATFLERQGLLKDALAVRQKQVAQSQPQPQPQAQLVAQRGLPHAAIAERFYRTGFLYYQCGSAEEGDSMMRRALEMRRELAGPSDATLQAWWRTSVLARGLGTAGWASEGLRVETWLTLDRGFTAQSPKEFQTDGVDWSTLHFQLTRWDGAARTGSALAEGDLHRLKSLQDPPPGVYLLSVSVNGPAGVLREVEWLLFTPWKVSFYDLRGGAGRVEWIWRQDVVEATPAEQREPALLSLSTVPGYQPGGPKGRTQFFAAVAETELDLPPGSYRLSFTATDGVRAWVDPAPGKDPLINAWDPHTVPTIEAAVHARQGDRPKRLRAEYFHSAGDFVLRLRAKPESPAADAAVAAALGENSDDMRRRLLREAALLEGARRVDIAGPLFARAVEIGRQQAGVPAAERCEALVGLGRYLGHKGASARAAEGFQEALELRRASLGASHDKTLRAARALAEALNKTGGDENHRKAKELLSYVATESAKVPDQQIRIYSDCLAQHPSDSPTLRQRGILYGSRWKIDQAAADFSGVFRFGTTEVDDLYLGGVTRLAVGDVAGYRDVCRQVLDRFGRSTAAGTQRRVVKTCCLSPDLVDIPETFVDIAEQATRSDPTNLWGPQVVALAKYRAGKWQEALDALPHPWRDLGGGTATNHAIAAMAHHRLGNTDDARNHLRVAQSALRETVPKDADIVLDPGAWHDWVICKILLTEAEGLIGSDAGNAAH